MNVRYCVELSQAERGQRTGLTLRQARLRPLPVCLIITRVELDPRALFASRPPLRI
jgi:hypothetical protein